MRCKHLRWNLRVSMLSVPEMGDPDQWLLDQLYHFDLREASTINARITANNYSNR